MSVCVVMHVCLFVFVCASDEGHSSISVNLSPSVSYLLLLPVHDGPTLAGSFHGDIKIALCSSEGDNTQSTRLASSSVSRRVHEQSWYDVGLQRGRSVVNLGPVFINNRYSLLGRLLEYEAVY